MSRMKHVNQSRRGHRDGDNGGKDSTGGMEFDMKKARFEVMKFAMNGLSGSARHDAETAFAISLGAKPPKSTHVNYKELQATRKKEKEERETHKLNHMKPKPTKFDSKTSAGKKSVQKKRSVGHTLETTGIYKVKVPPVTSKSSRKTTVPKNIRKRRN